MNYRILKGNPEALMSGPFLRQSLNDCGAVVIQRPGTSLIDLALALLEKEGITLQIEESPTGEPFNE